jgi:hypothetical protein
MIFLRYIFKTNHTYIDVLLAMLHPQLLAPVKSLPEMDIYVRETFIAGNRFKKIIITTTYSANLAQKHSLHEVIREIDTDSICPAVRVPAHILFLLISKSCDIIYI